MAPLSPLKSGIYDYVNPPSESSRMDPQSEPVKDLHCNDAKAVLQVPAAVPVLKGKVKDE